MKNNDADSERNDPRLRGGLGVCSVQNPNPKNGLRETTVVCPVRLYGNNYNALRTLAGEMLGVSSDEVLLFNEWQRGGKADNAVVLIGKYQGGELNTRIVGSFDWLAVRIAGRQVQHYAGIEVQAIDITGNYRAARAAYLKGHNNPPPSGHGLNWENVNKRIVPQLMRKGLYLQRLRDEGSVSIGFLVDWNVLQKIQARLSSPLVEETDGDFFIHAYYLDSEKNEKGMKSLKCGTKLRASIDQLVKKFTDLGSKIEPIKPWLNEKFALGN